jgi:hypothetical protein
MQEVNFLNIIYLFIYSFIFYLFIWSSSVLSFTLNNITLEPQATDKDKQFAVNTNFIKNVII